MALQKKTKQKFPHLAGMIKGLSHQMTYAHCLGRQLFPLIYLLRIAMQKIAMTPDEVGYFGINLHPRKSTSLLELGKNYCSK